MVAKKVLLFFMVGLLLAGFAIAAEEEEKTTPRTDKYFAAALAIGIPALAAGYSIAVSASAALGALAEKPEVFGKAVILVAFAEAIGIYGLLVSLMILLG